MIKVNIEEAFKTVRKGYQDLTGPELHRSVINALNHTIRKAKTASAQEIRKQYNIRSKDVKTTIRLTFARSGDLKSSLISTGGSIPIMAFRPRQTKKGVTVRIKGKRQLINSAFIATMKSGHKGVFARGQYDGKGKFKFRKKRTARSGYNDNPITELKTVGVPQALSNNIVMNHLARRIEEDFETRLKHEFSRARQYFGQTGRIRT